MALKFFEPEESNSNGSLDFLNDWLVENPKNKQVQFLITEVKRAQSNKGFIVSTEKFNVFLWKNAKLTKMLIEALDHYINESRFGYELYVVLKKPTKADFSIAANDESRITWFTSKNGYTTSEENATSQEEVEITGNPLIPAIP
ncbi:MAG TPA: hypothetical protein VFH06_05830 [Candidatus Saccharimonadales bacterium]|nr:hypothetical protein [Candidatus Saccharimonadales bacterium]